MLWKTFYLVLFCWLVYFAEVSGQQIFAKENFDIGTLRNVALTRTNTQTHVFRTISDANNYVNIGVPIGLFAIGFINDDKNTRQNAVYIGTRP